MATWEEVDQYINKALDCFFKACQAAEAAHTQSLLAHRKSVEAHELAVECRRVQLKFARKNLLLVGPL